MPVSVAIRRLGFVVSPLVATGPKTEGALVVVGEPKDNAEDRLQVQVLQRYIVAERVQREKEEALRVRLGAQLKATLEFIETHCHHN